MSTKSKANELSSPLHDGLEKPSSVEGWESLPLGQFAQAKGGYGFPMDRQGKKSGTYPFFKVSDMNLPANRKNMIDSNNWVDEDDLRVLKAKTFPSGAVVFPKIGATILTNKKRLLVRASVIDNNVMAVVIQDASRCGSDFLYYWFRTIDLGKLANPGTVPSITSSRIHDTPVLLPPLPEQQKIAAVLGVVQRAMEQQERLLALTAELKKALLHQLFTAGLRGEPQKQTDLGPVPESWEIVKLGALFQIKHGFAFAGEFFKASGPFVLLTPGHFHESGGFRHQGEKTKFYTGDFPSSYLLKKEDLLVVMTEQKEGLLGSSLLVPEADTYLHNQRLGLIQELDSARLAKRFLYYLLNTAPVRKRISMTAALAAGSCLSNTANTVFPRLMKCAPSGAICESV